jgi:hypothetical protein
MDKEDAGRKAGEIARTRFLQVLEKKGSLEKAALRIHQGLNAKLVKVFNDKEAGIVYSKPLVNHQTRLRAADLVTKAMDVLPDERIKMDVGGDLVDALKELNERHRQRTGDDGASGEQE